jgi:hypothetical protein
MQARDAAHELVRRTGDGSVALVFGNETSGMTNEEVGLCSMLPVTIPTDAQFSSLNLGAAVQVLSYELRMAALGEAAAAPVDAQAEPATHADFEGFTRTWSGSSPPAASTTRPTPSACCRASAGCSTGCGWRRKRSPSCVACSPPSRPRSGGGE